MCETVDIVQNIAIVVLGLSSLLNLKINWSYYRRDYPAAGG